MKIYFPIFLALIFSSCTKDSKMEIFDASSKYVVTSWLHPDSTAQVFVSKSNDATDNFIGNATVEFYINGNLVSTENNSIDGRYNMNVIASENDTCEFIIFGALGQVNGQTIVPEKPQFTVISNEYDITTDANNNLLSLIKLSIVDSLHEVNYFELRVDVASLNSSGEIIFSKNVLSSTNDLQLQNQLASTFNKSTLFSNSNFQNVATTLSFIYSVPSGVIINNEYVAITNKKIIVSLSKVSEEYFEFKNSFYEQSNTGNANIWNIPPSNVFSNVTNGFGIIASYNSMQDTID